MTLLAAPSLATPGELALLFEELRGARPVVRDFSRGTHAERRERAAHELALRGHAAWLVEGGPMLAYLTDARLGRSERLFAAVLLADSTVLWIAPNFERDRVAELARPMTPMTPITSATSATSGSAEILLWREHESPFALLAESLRARGATRLAIEPSTRAFVAAELDTALGVRTVCDRELAMVVRARKEPQEVERLRAAAVATKLAIRAASERLAPGHTERDLHALLAAAHTALGLENPWALALFGANSALPHGASGERRLERGDVVLVDAGGTLGGYQSDVTRTWTFGAPTVEFERTWHAVRDAQQAAFAALTPGTLARDVDRAARTSLERAGFGPQDRFFTHRLGHGIGLEGHEPPFLDGASGVPLAPGMTFSDEPGVYRPDLYGLRLEDVVLVTDGAPDVLGAWPTSTREPL